MFTWIFPFCNIRVHRSNFLDFDIFLSLEDVFILTDSTDRDEIPHHAAFHLGLQCLPK